MDDSSPSTAGTSVSPLQRIVPWVVATVCALSAVWAVERYYALQAEITLLRQQQAINDVTLRTLRTQLETEQLLTRRLVEEVNIRRSIPMPPPEKPTRPQ
jgi:hypothetical protein